MTTPARRGAVAAGAAVVAAGGAVALLQVLQQAIGVFDPRPQISLVIVVAAFLAGLVAARLRNRRKGAEGVPRGGVAGRVVRAVALRGGGRSAAAGPLPAAAGHRRRPLRRPRRRRPAARRARAGRGRGRGRRAAGRRVAHRAGGGARGARNGRAARPVRAGGAAGAAGPRSAAAGRGHAADGLARRPRPLHAELRSPGARHAAVARRRGHRRRHDPARALGSVDAFERGARRRGTGDGGAGAGLRPARRPRAARAAGRAHALPGRSTSAPAWDTRWRAVGASRPRRRRRRPPSRPSRSPSRRSARCARTRSSSCRSWPRAGR